MAIASPRDYMKLVPTVQATPQNSVWLTYDAEADVLYVNFDKPGIATDSDLTDDDVIIRYQGSNIIGYTILHASKRK